MPGAFTVEMRLHLAAVDGEVAELKKLLAAPATRSDATCSVQLSDDATSQRISRHEITTITVPSDFAAVEGGARTFQCPTLVAAAFHGQTQAARLLLDNGDDANLATSDGQTALMNAARWGHPRVLALLAERGADVSLVEPDTKFGAFHYACVHNQPESAEVLLRAGADPNHRARG